MRYRRLINGEPQFGQGQQNFVQGAEAVAQAIETRLKLFTGEWWEDTNDGLPFWTQMVSTNGSNRDKISMLVTARILDTNLNGIKLVSRMNSVSNIWNGTLRRYTYNGSAQSIYGNITISNGG